MSIKSYLENLLSSTNDIQDIIDGLDTTFNSHQFIEKFAHTHEEEYIDMLVQYKGKKAFKTVHSQIAKFLKAHSGKAPLNIRDTGTTINLNVFGNVTEVHVWVKI